MQTVEKSGLILIRLFPGEGIFASLQNVCRKYNVQTGVVISAIGQIKDFTLGFLDGTEYRKKDFVQTFELLSISGTISRLDDGDYFLHLHTVVGDKNYSAFGGHLFKGTVEGTNEIAILNTPILSKRQKDQATGLLGLHLEPEVD
jgi:uncharacterized protein